MQQIIHHFDLPDPQFVIRIHIVYSYTFIYKLSGYPNN